MIEEILIADPRTWEELSSEVQARTDRQVYPMTGMRSEDVADILSAITSLDRDEWGTAWAAKGRSWIERGEAHAREGRTEEAKDAFLLAWRYSNFGGWPVAISPKKQESYELSLDAFRRYRELQDPRIESVSLELPGGETFTFLLQLPATARPAPVMISIGGLDSYKEYVAERYGPVYMANEVGYVAADAPNTGEAAMNAAESGSAMFSAIIDYLLTRPDVDRTKIGVQGVSMGGYWSTRVAVEQRDRLALAVNWAGPINEAWSEAELRKSLRTREYLFDFKEALLNVWSHADPEALILNQWRNTVGALGIVGEPTPPMLIVNGLKDTLVPPSDTMLLLENGTPKSAWINPNGYHLGRSPEWNDERIMREVIMPWILTEYANADRG